MHEIRCDTPDCNRFLARLNGAVLEIWCPRCKTFHPVTVVDLVGDMVVELRNGHEPKQDKLLW